MVPTPMRFVKLEDTPEINLKWGTKVQVRHKGHLIDATTRKCQRRMISLQVSCHGGNVSQFMRVPYKDVFLNGKPLA